MLDVSVSVVTALKTILPVYPEQYIQKATYPCITYAEDINADTDITAMNAGYSRIGYCIKLWGSNLSTLATNRELVDEKMRNLGFKRTALNQLLIDDVIQVAMNYEATGYEVYIVPAPTGTT